MRLRSWVGLIGVTGLVAACSSGGLVVDGEDSGAGDGGTLDDASASNDARGVSDATSNDGATDARATDSTADAATDATADATGDAGSDARADGSSSDASDGAANDGDATAPPTDASDSGNDVNASDASEGGDASDSGASDAQPTDSGENDAGSNDASDASDASLSLPASFRLDIVSPGTVTAGEQVTLDIDGVGWSPIANVGFAGQSFGIARASNFVSSGSVTIPASALPTPGYFPITIQNVTGDPASASPPVTLRVVPSTSGSPVVYRVWPDWGVAGDVITLEGDNLDGSVEIRDAANHSVNVPGASTNLSFELPQGWVSGPWTVTTTGGSWTTPPFRVGVNLLRQGVATATSTFSGYPATRAVDGDLDTSWFAASDACGATCGTQGPIVTVVLAQLSTVSAVAIRGNRQYPYDYEMTAAKIEFLGSANVVLGARDVLTPYASGDIDVELGTPIANVRSIRVRVQAGKSGPGFAELEAF